MCLEPFKSSFVKNSNRKVMFEWNYGSYGYGILRYSLKNLFTVDNNSITVAPKVRPNFVTSVVASRATCRS